MPGSLLTALFALAVVSVSCVPVVSRAETLADAIALAYQSNPTLQSQRAQQRALDETYVQARAGWRPNASLSAGVQYTNVDLGRSNGSQLVNTGTGSLSVSGAGGYDYNTSNATLQASQPLYTGGRTAAAVSAAEAQVLAGREGLRTTESQVLASVIGAYEDVRRDQRIVGIRAENLRVLQSQLDETQTKFQAGQVTRVDTAQAEAQYAQARALLSSAQAQLQISRSNYAAVVGQNPGELTPEPALPGLPATVDQAFDIAERRNPSLLQAQLTEQASRARIVQARAAKRPTVSLQGQFGYTGTVAPFDPRNYDRNFTGQLVFNQPLFTGGVTSSQIRQATEQNTSDRISIEGFRRQVVQQVSQAWNVLLASRANVGSNGEQVRAAQVAFEGIQEQYRAGLSTTLDVLIQQENLRIAQLALVQAEHDAYVAEANLLAAMGRLEARDLVRGVDLYDPAQSFASVKRASAVPWEGVIERIDTAGGPKGSLPKPIVAPAAPSGPVMAADPEAPVPTHAAPALAVPTAPAPDTVSPATPATLGARPGVAEPVAPPAPVPVAKP